MAKRDITARSKDSQFRPAHFTASSGKRPPTEAALPRQLAKLAGLHFEPRCFYRPQWQQGGRPAFRYGVQYEGNSFVARGSNQPDAPSAAIRRHLNQVNLSSSHALFLSAGGRALLFRQWRGQNRAYRQYVNRSALIV
jgi:hypothetical protein